MLLLQRTPNSTGEKKQKSVQPYLYETVAVHVELGLALNPLSSGYLNQYVMSSWHCTRFCEYLALSTVVLQLQHGSTFTAKDSSSC